jgi:hypothetical protein
VKRGIVVVIVVVAIGAVLLFAFQGRVDAPATVGVKPAPAAAEKATAPSARTGKPEGTIYDEAIRKYGDNIEWLTFSRTAFPVEREFIRQYFAEDIKKAESMDGVRVDIVIAKADVNSDGKEDIIWILEHRYFRAFNKRGTLGMFVDIDGEKKHIKFFSVAWPIGLRPSVASNWKDIIIGGEGYNLYSWNGTKYWYVEEPLEILAEGQYYKVTRDSDGRYTVTVYDDGRNVVDRFRHLNEPKVSMVDGEILRTVMLYDNHTWPTHEYYDRTSKKTSWMYHNVLADRHDRVVYLTEDYRLIIRNMFDEKVYYKEVKRDFAPLPKEVRRMAILNIAWDKPGAIVVSYLAGPERRIVTEEIILD